MLPHEGSELSHLYLESKKKNCSNTFSSWSLKIQTAKKMKLPFLFKATDATSTWPWPTCGRPKTLSFRANKDMCKTINSAYAVVDIPTNSFEAANFCLASEEASGDSVEVVIRGLRSDRLFFEPGETSSILEEAKTNVLAYKESVVMAMDSRDPFSDFKQSMEEMVEAHGLKDWECLEELLCCYLRVNGKSNRGYIVGAFVDLLVGLSLADDHDNDISCSTITTSHSFTSPLSFDSSATSSTTSPCLSLSEIES